MNPHPEGSSSVSLPLFFRRLADQIENNELAPERLMNAGEMFMYYMTQDALENMSEDEKGVLDTMKCLTLGFYFYHILKLLPPARNQVGQEPSL